MTGITRSGLGVLACGLLALFVQTAFAADPAKPTASAADAADVTDPTRAPRADRADLADEPATLRILNRDVVTMRARVGGLTPKLRVQRAQERLREMPAAAVDDPLKLVQARLGDTRGVTFLLGGRPLFSVVESDVDIEARQGFDALVKETQARLESVRAAWHEVHDQQRLLGGLLRTAVASLVFGVLAWVTYRLGRRAVAWMERKRDVLAARHPYIDWREFLGRLGVGALHLAQWLVLFTLAYWWMYYVLASFALTAPLAATLGDWLFGKLVWIGEGVLASLPGLATVALVLLITRAAADLLRYFFDAVQKGRLRIPLFHPETASATRRIVTLLIWALGAALAYPYLPGSSSEAFKGVSVLLGVMITLGSAGLITQAMSGLVVVYSRSLRRGDFIDVNGVQGVVTEVAALAIKVIDVRNEEITIPNAVVVASPIRNYTRLGGSDGTLLTTKVSIGYDVPWRQVQALLIAAARKTSGVRDAPAPYVYQRALSDFYVEYELFASLADPRQRVAGLSELHACILDEFNEHGVQIMSPHFLGQPGHAVVVPKEQWYAAPARGT
jgi:small-conductance mechanosensitive channel